MRKPAKFSMMVETSIGSIAAAVVLGRSAVVGQPLAVPRELRMNQSVALWIEEHSHDRIGLSEPGPTSDPLSPQESRAAQLDNTHTRDDRSYDMKPSGGEADPGE